MNFLETEWRPLAGLGGLFGTRDLFTKISRDHPPMTPPPGGRVAIQARGLVDWHRDGYRFIILL